MRVIFESLNGIKVNRDIDISDTPITILRKFYEEEKATAVPEFFCSYIAINQLMTGDVDEERGAFDLLLMDGETIQADWRTPLCAQPSIKEELELMESQGQVPTFVIMIISIV